MSLATGTVKIQNDKTDHVERPDEPAEKKSSKKSEEKKDFKKLLEGKKDGKGQKQADKTPADKKPAKALKGAKQPAQQAPKRADGFNKRLKGGELQLGQQLEQKSRLGSERNVARHQNEARLEHRHQKKHHRQVHTEHTHKSRRGQDAPIGASASGSRHEGKDAGIGASASSSRHEGKDALAPNHVAKSAVGAKATAKAEGKAPVEQSKLRAEVAELARKLVERAHVGRDASGRQIMLLDLQVPGRGNVRVRLRRRGEGFELRMRPENEDFARDLRREREHFRQSAAENGVEFTSIEIV